MMSVGHLEFACLNNCPVSKTVIDPMHWLDRKTHPPNGTMNEGIINEPKIDPTVWLLTDFGLRTYVGTMKAVIKSICPKSQIY